MLRAHMLTGMAVYTCNQSISDGEGEGTVRDGVQLPRGQPGGHQTLSQNKENPKAEDEAQWWGRPPALTTN